MHLHEPAIEVGRLEAVQPCELRRHHTQPPRAPPAFRLTRQLQLVTPAPSTRHQRVRLCRMRRRQPGRLQGPRGCV